jgi:cephalosporin hydroxylase
VTQFDEDSLHTSFRIMDTVLGDMRQHSRRLITPDNGISRLVPFENRRWVTDLPLSDQLIKSIQNGKYAGLKWRGASLLKDPFDFTLYPQLLAELRPPTILELGAYEGASAAWLADMLTVMGAETHVYSFDIDLARIRVRHPQVTFLAADLSDLDTLETATFGRWQLRSLPHPWLVIEDAHTNVYNVLSHFDGYMRLGDYVVAEDLLDRDVYVELRRFAIDRGYHVDTKYTDMFGYNMTWNLNGFLCRMK